MKRFISIMLVCFMFATLLPVAVFADDVVEIDTAEEFAAIADNLGGSYKLTADITITQGLSYKNEGAKFSGTFDGDGHTVTLDFVDTERQRAGLFCSVDGGTVKNLTVKGKLESNGNSTGGIIGTVVGAGATLENVTNEVSFSAPNSTNGQGGLIGAVEGGTVTIKNCANKGNIVGEVVGGFVGGVHNNETTIIIENSVNEGNVECTNLYADYRGAGGFVGKCNNGWQRLTIKNSENKGNVTAKYVVANAYVGHNNIDTGSGWTFDLTGTTNSGKITSGGLVLDAATAVARDQGIWGGAGFGFNAETKILSGSPNFHALPTLTGYKAYVCGVEATDKVTLEEVVDGNRQVKVTVDCSGAPVDGYASVTIVWADGKYSTFGAVAPTAEAYEITDTSAETLSKHNAATIDTDAFSADATEGRFLKDGQTEAHGSEGNLFDGVTNGKYEGWKKFGQSTVIYFQTTEAIKVGYYALGTGGDDMAFPSRQPAEWKLWASVDGKDYVVIDEQSYDLPNINNRFVAFEARTETAYKFFKLEIVKIAEEVGYELGENETKYGYSQLGEIAIYKACEHQWGDPVVEDATCTEDGSSTVTCGVCGKTEVTEIKAEGHDMVDGVCSVCGHKEGEPDTPAETGDIAIVAIAAAVVALIGTAVICKKRTVC